MPVYKDVEQGIPEDNENRMTLLPHDDGNRMRPIRPMNPINKNEAQSPAAPHSFLQKLQLEPSSILSTPESTPALDTGEWPKKWRRSDRRLRRLNTELLEAIEADNVEEAERLLKAGANANATCRLDFVSACHIAAFLGGDTLELLIKFGAEKNRQDRLGRTPIHLAAFAGNIKSLAILLDLPEDMHVGDDDVTSIADEDIKKIHQQTKAIVNMPCDLEEIQIILPNTWKDNIDHNCMDIKGSIPLLQPGWTPLHVAASCAREHCTRLLLAAGADPNICDLKGRTALDVAGSAYYHKNEIKPHNFTEEVKMLLKAGSKFHSMKGAGLNVDTPLHTAVELSNLDCIKELLDAGVSICCLNSAGLTPLHVCVKKRLEEPLQILANYEYTDIDPLMAMIDVKDKDGFTVLQASVKAAWIEGVCIALESGADVTIKANDGETSIHLAATLGNVDVLNELLSLAKQKNFIDYRNEEGETPLFKAIKNGHFNCVSAILNEGASIKLTMPGEVNVLHVAAEYEHLDILKLLLEYENGMALELINSLTAPDRRGFGPIHFAVYNNNVECLRALISKNADIRLRTTSSPYRSSTPLHLAAMKNYEGIAKTILEYDNTTIHEVNTMGWYPLHTAGHHGSREIIMLLLKEGADLSGYTDGPDKYRRTAIDMIVNNLSKPTKFLQEVFDSYISANSQNIQDSKCEVTVDYRILMPTICEMDQMKVIEALVETGNNHGQTKLLVHPLVESFLYLKWKALLPFFYTIIAIYFLFVSSLTLFTLGIFFYQDNAINPPPVLNPNIWGWAVYVTLLLIIIQEIFYFCVKRMRYFLQLETWIKFCSITLSALLPSMVTINALATTEWPRHVATCALLLSWIELMFLLSRFPNWGYYVLMFGKVAVNVIKILLTFAFLVIGFSLSFMIQFHSQIPFDGIWASIVKTMVMMTSEFDYVDLFDEEHTQDISTSLILARLIFLIFLILAAIVLMNLLVGVAVNDINHLEVLGNIESLEKQIDFLGTLDNLVYNTLFNIILPKRLSQHIRKKKKVTSVMILCPGKPRGRLHRSIPARIRNAILDKAQQQKEQQEMETNMDLFRKQINEMHEAITKTKEIEKPQIINSEVRVVQRAKNDKHSRPILDDEVTKVKEQFTTYVEEINVKIYQISLEIETMKHFLNRLENRLFNV